MVIGMKTFSIWYFDLRCNVRFLLRHGDCVIITLTIALVILRFATAILQRNIWGLFRLFLVPKNRTKTVNYNSHKENCEDFLISDWILRKAKENFSVQVCDHFKRWRISFIKFCSKFQYKHITDTLKWIIYQNLPL